MDQEGFPGFEASRNLPFMAEGNQNVDSVAQYVDSTIYRDPEGKVRGLRYGFTKSSGVMVTSQGDEISMSDTGGFHRILNYATVPLHEAEPIETQTVSFPNGDVMEISTQPVGRLFDGNVQPGQPLYVEGSQSLDTGIVAGTFVSRTESVLITVGVIGQGTSVTTKRVELHNPFTQADKRPAITDPSFSIDTPRPTLVKSMTPEQYHTDPSLHLITKISKSPVPSTP